LEFGNNIGKNSTNSKFGMTKSAVLEWSIISFRGEQVNVKWYNNDNNSQVQFHVFIYKIKFVKKLLI